MTPTRTQTSLLTAQTILLAAILIETLALVVQGHFLAQADSRAKEFSQRAADNALIADTWERTATNISKVAAEWRERARGCDTALNSLNGEAN